MRSSLSTLQFLFFVSLICIAFMPNVARGATINVPADQPTIQAAINAASNGDTVVVAPGTYYENINFKGKAITVTSAGGPAVTTINGRALDSVVTFRTNEGSTSVLSGFTITNGLPASYLGGGVYIYSASPTISGNVITGNMACSYGGGIFASSSSAVIQGNTITNNSQTGCSGGGGGGIAILSAGSVQVIDNTIANNSWHSDGAGILLNAAGTPTIRNNRITGNTGTSSGAIYIINDSNASIVQNLIVGNRPGGVSFSVPYGSRGPYLINNTIANNDGGPGVYAGGFDSQAQLVNNLIVAAAGQPALYCSGTYSGAPPTVQNTDAFGSGGPGFDGTCAGFAGMAGNISADPLFIDGKNNFHLQAGSPAADAGNNTAPGLTTTDFDGTPRTVDGNSDGTAIVDMGAFELKPTTANVSPAALSFGNQPIGSTTVQTVTLSNTGDQNLILSISLDNAGFQETDDCGSPVAPGASCTINVTFAPTTAGNMSANLSIRSNATGSPHVLELSGTGVEPTPAVSLSPATLTFTSQLVNTTSAAQAVTLTNTGTTPLSISGIAASGDFAQTNGCGSTVAAGASCSISVTFTPLAAGTRTGAVTITDNASGSPHSVALSGTGAAPAVSLSPASLTFGTQVVGTTSAAQSVTLTNTGTATMTISAISAAGDFAQTNNCGATVPAGASCSILVTFSPTAAGTRTGALAITDDASGSPQAVPLSGTAAAPTVSLSPGSLTFATQVVGTTSSAQTVTLSNIGSTPLAIIGITASGDFAQTSNCSTTLAAGAKCSISVKFRPTDAGTRTGFLAVADNAAGSPHTVQLTGNGLDFALSASPSSASISAGQTAQFTVTAVADGGAFNNSVNLSCSGLPAASKCQFSPAGVTPHGGSATSNLTIQTTSGNRVTPPGIYTITINGSSGSLKHSTAVTLIVNP